MTLFEKVLERKWEFVALFTCIYFVSLVFLGTLGFAPWSGQVHTTLPPEAIQGVAVAKGEGEEPIRVEIPSIGIRTLVQNPEETSITVLDAALLKGAVRYPDSGMPGEEGNVLLFGHSSQLPVVQNQAFKAFNDIQNLEKGDPIFVIGKTKVYVYVVDEVKEATTESDAVPLEVEGAKLTLATCNNFGTKEDRFIVTATLVKIDTLPEPAS